MLFSVLNSSFKCGAKLMTYPSVKNVCPVPHRYCHQIIISKTKNVNLKCFNTLGVKNKNHIQGVSNIFARKEYLLSTKGVRHFHTSPPKNALPGVIYLIFKPILRVGAIVVARMSRKWWSKLTPEQKRAIYSYLKKHQATIAGISLTGVALTYIYYFLHLETCPITGRQKFIIVKPNQLNEISGLTYDLFVEEHKNQILPLGHPAYKQPTRVVKRLLDANQIYTKQKNLNYPITIIDDPTINAFVLPDGRICIFTGIFQLCQTDDELASVLAHELSHSLLKHVAEKLSNKTLLEILYIVPLMLVWFLLPDLGAIITHVLLDDIKGIMFELPFERDMETEADEVGLKMMARACFDVRVAPLFWQKMTLQEAQDPNNPQMKEFLSTHPSHENRAKNLELKMKEAIDIRKECNCLPLGPFVVPRQIQWFNFLKPAPPG